MVVVLPDRKPNIVNSVPTGTSIKIEIPRQKARDSFYSSLSSESSTSLSMALFILSTFSVMR